MKDTDSTECRQIGGTHYQGNAIDPLSISTTLGLVPSVFSVIKYIDRHDRKGGLIDLQKAHNCCDHWVRNGGQRRKKLSAKLWAKYVKYVEQFPDAERKRLLYAVLATNKNTMKTISEIKELIAKYAQNYYGG